MKFLCDQCKAKYQIADEKVQGKTLRMKCRKCGHVIEIRAAAEAPATGATTQLSALSDEDAAAIVQRASIPPPAPAGKPAAPPKPAIATKPGTMPPRAAPLKTPAPRPVSNFGPTGARTAPGKELTQTKPPGSGALASAFNKQVTTSAPTHIDTPPPATQTGADVPTEEWYVAIDDVPVGPIRLSELRAKYAQGAARDESLVWREGYEEWRPLRSLPDLHRVVKEEGARGGSLLPNNQKSSSTRTSAPQTTSRPSPRPAAAATPPARSGNVIPFVQPRGGAAAARKVEEDFDEEATQIAASPFQQQPKPEPPISAPVAKVHDDPFGPPPQTGPFAPIAAPISSQPIAPAPMPAVAVAETHSESRGPSKGIVALIAAACLLFGVVIAVFAIKPKVVEKVVEKRVDVPVSVMVPGGPTETATAATTAAPEPTQTNAPKVAVKSGGGNTTTQPAATASVAAPSKKLGNDMGPEGPSVGGTGPGTAAGGGGALDGKAVEGVVASKRVGVRKVCYEPWADKGGASVKVTLKIGSDGRVQSSDIASTSGEPAIGQCVQRLSKTWTFPASESGGTFNVPFLFGT